jgi:phosphonate transport system permease protein
MTSAADYFKPKLSQRLFALGLLAYVVYAFASMGLTGQRLLDGLGYSLRFIEGFFPPNFARGELLAKGLFESVQIAILASLIGTLLAIPLAVIAARNLMPAVVTWPARVVIILCRSFHPIILAIIAVKAVGFGALAGVIALTIASIGFIGKLLAEAIEEVSLKQIEAVRATGAGFFSVIVFGVIPQVMNRFIGFAAYETDANLRNSTMVGVVGAGGIGGTLFAAFQRFDYDFVAAIILSIIVLILAAEVAQSWVKGLYK